MRPNTHRLVLFGIVTIQIQKKFLHLENTWDVEAKFGIRFKCGIQNKW